MTVTYILTLKKGQEVKTVSKTFELTSQVNVVEAATWLSTAVEIYTKEGYEVKLSEERQ